MPKKKKGGVGSRTLRGKNQKGLVTRIHRAPREESPPPPQQTLKQLCRKANDDDALKASLNIKIKNLTKQLKLCQQNLEIEQNANNVAERKANKSKVEYDTMIAKAKAEHEAVISEAKAEHEAAMAEAQAEHDAAIFALIEEHNAALNKKDETIKSLSQQIWRDKKAANEVCFFGIIYFLLYAIANYYILLLFLISTDHLQ